MAENNQLTQITAIYHRYQHPAESPGLVGSGGQTHFSEGLGDLATRSTAGGTKHCTESISGGLHEETHSSDHEGSALLFRDAMYNVQQC